ncbi:MAG: hypothetical protein V4654_08080 [Bdellovibrionota bacterium]
MKKLFILTTCLISFSAFAAQVGSFQVKGCSLIVPNTTPDEVTEALMAKGYRPMNVLDVTTHDTQKDLSGSFEIRASKELQDSALLAGFPYLEIKVDSVRGATFSNLSVGIVGVKVMPKYNSSKTILPLQRDVVQKLSAEELPACVEN